MALRKYVPSSDAPSLSMLPLKFNNNVHEKAQLAETGVAGGSSVEADVDIDLREVYFLIMHFLSAGPCHRTYGQFWNELLEHQLLPRRYHAWYSRRAACSGDENDNGLSFPLSYNKLVERYPHVEKDHLVKLLKQLILTTAPPSQGMVGGNAPNAADVPTLLGSGSFSLLASDRKNKEKQTSRPPVFLRWPHMQADQVRGLSLREIGGGFTKHHRAPSIRAACYAIAKPSTMVQKMENTKKLRGHRDAVYCAIFDRSGRYVITGSDDRLVKIWSMETAFCLASCRGHEGDITDLAVSSNNALVASASNDFVIRVWRLPDGVPISVLRGHTGAVTAIAFSPRPTSTYVYNLLSSSDDGTCRIWDARNSQSNPRIYLPKPSDAIAGRSNGPSSIAGPQAHQILCCAYNASGTVFVTGSSDTYARVWNACKFNSDDIEQPIHETDILSGHENDVNYVQFSGCAVASRSCTIDTSKEENFPKFKNSRFTQDYIVTCSRDGSAIIWTPRSRKSHGRAGRWARAYHLKVPPPPMPPQPPRGGPRQRFLPTPRGVNMIVWSLDDRFVLAAIMDCRICVWNAIDGSLVHSLTGHSESTYVLDVHPFNPRIAMSAGYDGKTIIWDIWEGTPIRIYEIGRFRLIDGKFSPDGTSIVLSDDVGQIYILTTGQGESQKDAKYDQFFLGDYRPLIQDTHGNILDQETQLLPYRRNFQDPLCDSTMIPYPEPYQSMFQRRRLGALGIEWNPSSVKFAVGPADINGFQDYQMVPLMDLDRIFEPLPEFLDAMDWEPEIEAQSEDNDSEYNVTDECYSDGERGRLSCSLSDDPGSSSEDSEGEQSHKDGLRRSKRKKLKGEVELMTSSGRRVKRRNLDERDGTIPSSNRTKKLKSGRKASRRKSSTSKSLRPQRVAARNALNLFSRITGASTDEEAEGSESDSLDSDSNLDSNESDRSMQNVERKSSKGKEVSLDESEDVFKAIVPPESQTNTGGRRRLVLKLPARDLKKPVPQWSSKLECEEPVDLVGTSSKASEGSKGVNRNLACSQDQMACFGDAFDVSRSRISETGKSEKVEDHIDLSTGYKGDKIRWGEVKIRSSKRFRSGDAVGMDACLGSNSNHDDNDGLGNSLNEHLVPEKPSAAFSPDSETQNRIIVTDTDGDTKELALIASEDKSSLLGESTTNGNMLRKRIPVVACNGNLKGFKEQSGPSECMDYDEPLEGEVGLTSDDHTASEHICKNGTDLSQELKESTPRISTKLRIRSRMIWKGPNSPTKLNSITVVEDSRSSGCDSQLPSHMDRCLAPEVPIEGEGTSGRNLENEDENGIGGEAHTEKLSSLQDPKMMHSDTQNRMYSAVYRRSKTYRARSNSEGDAGVEGSTSNASNHNHDPLIDSPEAQVDGIRRTRSMGIKTSVHDVANSNLKVSEGHKSVETSRRAEKFVLNTHDQLLREEWRPSTKINVGLRSARNRRGNYPDSPVDKKRSSHTTRKLSWLMLLEHELSYRYIPQKGDEVVYVRQGHEEYLEWRKSSEAPPGRLLKGNLRSVEFCSVIALDYSTLPGSGESCCKITLEFVDSQSSVFGKTFKLTLPELSDFSDFIVERTRYEASINRNWTVRDKCQVWWQNESGDGGSFWDGRIMSVKPKSSDNADSPWERYTIHYKSDPGPDHRHSPWELHDPGIRWEHPQIDDNARSFLLAAFTKLEQSRNSINKDSYGIHKLNQVAEKSDFLNRFPVALSFDVIHSRLERNYYRSVEALKHDFTVMMSNAQAYFGKNVEFATKMRRLLDWFNKTMSSL